ncbi:hypothetical protein [Microbulbifer magnicolonia]|uniref:hypothetical protein n=1 Tax=Microbulbifer magnicolonia TaxID=3109744 RepID=UPI002B40CC40|nr:hypothetical protein [Microbulbifer sp. GG15]
MSTALRRFEQVSLSRDVLQVIGASMRYAVFFVPLIAVAYGLLFVLDPEVAYRWGFEDGPVEWLGATCLAVSAALFAWTAAVHAKNGLSKFWLTALAVLFLFGAGEEISWGQRVFSFSTPELIAEQNKQGEANIHNLAFFHALNDDGSKKSGLARWVTGERMFSLFWLAFCILLPAAYVSSRFLANRLAAMSMPIVNLSLGVYFLAIYLAAELLVPFITGARGDLGYALMETKETLYSVLFAIIAFDLAQRARTGNHGIYGSDRVVAKA